MSNESNSNMGDEFDQAIRKLTGLPDTVSTRPTTVTTPKPPRGTDPDYILSGARGYLKLVRCDIDLASWLQLKLSCSRATAVKAATWAKHELKRLGEPYERTA